MRIPFHIWAYALRIWLAAVIALYAAFWLQLGGASSAAVTVAILAQPTRGAALSKAANRLAATFIGATMSIVIAGLFPGERIGLLLSFICWICICVFAASYLRGYRAYAAVLSGYTVAIITVANIDTPQNVFDTMTDRVAAITIGILCVTMINDLFGSPSVWLGLDRKIGDIWRDVREYARGVLSKGQEDPEKAGDLLSEIAGLREDVDVVGHDMADGRYRAAGARSAMLALVEMVYLLRRLSLSKCDDPVAISVRAQCLAALEDEGWEASTLLSRLRESELSRQNIVVGAVGQVQQAIRFVESKGLFDDGMWSLREGRPPARDVRLPDTKEFFFALRNAFRIGVALSAGAIFLVLAGWPASVAALSRNSDLVCAQHHSAEPVEIRDSSHRSVPPRSHKCRYCAVLRSDGIARLRSTRRRNSSGPDLRLFAERAATDRRDRCDHERSIPGPARTIQSPGLQPAELLLPMHLRGVRALPGLLGNAVGLAGVRPRQATRSYQGDKTDFGVISIRQPG